MARQTQRAVMIALAMGTGCATPIAPVEVEQKRGDLHEPLSAGPTLDQVKPLTFEDDRNDVLSFLTFPAGEVRFNRPPPQKAAKEARQKATPVRCEIDRDCQSPDRCLRPAGSPGFGGVCGQSKNAAGASTDEVRYVQSCREEWECPDDFDCVPVDGPWGLCVKLRDKRVE